MHRLVERNIPKSYNAAAPLNAGLMALLMQ
jgi:hypothetical protein